MNLITLDIKSEFDKLPNFDIGVGDFLKKVDLAQGETSIPIVVCGNPTITGVKLVEACLDQGAQAMIDISLPIDDFVSMKKNTSKLPIVRITKTTSFEVAYKVAELIELGYEYFAVYTKNNTSDEAIQFIQKIESSGAWVFASVSNHRQVNFLESETSCKIQGGYILSTPSSLKGLIKSNIMEDIKLIRSMIYDRGLLVEDEISKPLDMVKAIALGANGVVLTDILASTEESVGEIIENNGVQYKKYSSNEDSNQDLIQLNGPVINILVEYENVLREIMSITKTENIEDLMKYYDHFNLDIMKFV